MVRSAILIALLAFVILIAGCAKREASVPPSAPPQHVPDHTNAAGISIIKDIETLQLKPYRLDGQWYVGYGHALEQPRKPITEAQAEHFLRKDLALCEDGIRDAVSVPMNGNEFSAMASLCYTLGVPRFKATSVVERLNAGDRKGAADAFLRLTKAADEDGRKRVLNILEARRERERALFLSPPDITVASRS